MVLTRPGTGHGGAHHATGDGADEKSTARSHTMVVPMVAVMTAMMAVMVRHYWKRMWCQGVCLGGGLKLDGRMLNASGRHARGMGQVPVPCPNA